MLTLFLRVFSFITLIVCLCLTLVSVSSHHWSIRVHSHRDEHMGLWKFCNERGCKSVEEVKGTHDWLYVVRAFGCLAAIIYVISLVYFLLAWFVLDRSCHNFFVSAFILLSGGFMFVAMALYTRNDNQKDYKWGWSYLLGWFGFFVSLVSFSMSFIYSRMVLKAREQIMQRYTIELLEER